MITFQPQFLKMANRTSEDYENERDKQAMKAGSVLDYLFGVVFIAIGIVCFVRFNSEKLMIAFGAVAVIYGIWKIYKGYKKASF